MTPMVDVVFLLLVFFVWTSSFEIPEFDLPGAIAQPPAGGNTTATQVQPAEAFDEIVIRLQQNQGVLQIELMGETLLDVAEVRTRIAQVLQLGVQPPVIVDPADDVTMESAVNVYDAAREAGADRVLFAAKAE